ncbi:LPXTG-site transpeptidase (sortase) family protein [Streptomyces achromogenes]|uniref:class F sortase n=1 Tax=Streptomyces achromogenes TaxID=67255 RepID=UPI00278A5ECB|nr:class F sortase [Streptomyces achromogenes]MDQ0833709.1 LPXTG-site transpeptidase (sortase) family protein [Streptomyces achromogenes]
MSPLSRRAAALTALAVLLLTSCGGGETPAAVPDAGASASGPASSSASSAPSVTAGRPVRPLARSAPVGLRIAAIGVDTPVMRLGLAADGSVQVPPVEKHDRAGWYEHSPTPGQTGPSVILGHVTVGRYGDGVFRRLGRLRAGDRIAARLENGTTAEFAVTEVRTVDKARFPTQDVYGNVDRPELRLITCGGPRTGDGYRDNVIVFAVLSAGSSTGSNTGPGVAPSGSSSSAGER